MPALRNSLVKNKLDAKSMKMLNSDRTPACSGARFFFRRSFFLGFLFAFLAALVWYGNQLQVVLIPEGNAPSQAFTVEKGEEWHYHYTHSVQKTPVDEFFRIEGAGRLTMTHTTYESLGVGLPYAPSEGRFTSLKEKGKFDVEMNRPYRFLQFRTASQAMPKIVYKDKIYDLYGLYGQGVLVEVRVMKRYERWLL